MKWRIESGVAKLRGYEIKHEPMVGFWLYVFEDEKCVRDDLQDTLEAAMEVALEDYGVPKEAWQKASK